MLDLTFGEQVKIILSRKGMTIKELAEMIEERTGKKMSRQNLTQRLGRDNFQEQDMRMIAEILDCPFQLNILGDARQPENTDEESVHVTEAELQRLEKKKGRRHRPVERDITIGELVELNEGLDQLLEEKEGLLAGGTEPEPAEKEEAQMRPEQEAGEEAAQSVSETYEKADEAPAAEPEVTEPAAAEEEAAVETAAEKEDMPQEDVTQPEEAERPAKKARGSWRDFFQRRTRREQKETTSPAEPENNLPAAPEEEEESQGEPETGGLEEAPEKDVEELLQRGADEEEDLEKGEVNPYTGHEYESNTVRMHPKRIGYVQVYDRSIHQWTDMTEWAFLGYQERKKALLGNDYEPPIYLD